MAEKWREAQPRGGEPFDSHEGGLGLGQSFGRVHRGADRWGQPVAQPADLVLGFEN